MSLVGKKNMKLLICSADHKPKGWKTLDANPKYNADYTCTVPPLPIISNLEEVAIIHGIEHFFLWEARELLDQIYESLIYGGKLILEQPNIMFAAKVILGIESPLTETPNQSDLWPLYGDPTHKDPLYVHKWGYYPNSLRSLLQEVGFSDIEELPAKTHFPKRDFRMEAVK